MTDTVDIEYSDLGTKGRYVVRVAGQDAEAELTISKLSDTLVIADHTAVPDELRGRGMAAALAARLVADARKNGQRIVPLCPFFRSYAERNRDALADVINF